MFYNSKTGKFKASPYDFDDPEWDPIYIYCGLPEKKAGQR
jgi:hypothetical protein